MGRAGIFKDDNDYDTVTISEVVPTLQSVAVKVSFPQTKSLAIVTSGVNLSNKGLTQTCRKFKNRSRKPFPSHGQTDLKLLEALPAL